MMKRAGSGLLGLFVVVAALLGTPASAALAATNDSITLFSAVGTPFAPNFAPLPTTVALGLTLARSARVIVDVLNSNNNVVRVIQPKTALTAGQYSWSWDGQNNGGTMVADGVYTVRVKALNGLGTAVVKKPVRKGLPPIFPANPGSIV